MKFIGGVFFYIVVGFSWISISSSPCFEKVDRWQCLFKQNDLILFAVLLLSFYEFFVRRLINPGLLKYIFLSETPTLPDWISSKTSNAQNSDYRELVLNGNRLSQFEFYVDAPVSYWRVGVKLCSPNGFILPLLSEGSLLLHIGADSASDKVTFFVYRGGQLIVQKPDILDQKVPIKVALKVNENNFVSCFIDDKLEFEGRVDASLFKKVYIVAWTDGHDAGVKLSKIKFSY